MVVNIKFSFSRVSFLEKVLFMGSALVLDSSADFCQIFHKTKAREERGEEIAPKYYLGFIQSLSVNIPVSL